MILFASLVRPIMEKQQGNGLLTTAAFVIMEGCAIVL